MFYGDMNSFSLYFRQKNQEGILPKCLLCKSYEMPNFVSFMEIFIFSFRLAKKKKIEVEIVCKSLKWFLIPHT